MKKLFMIFFTLSSLNLSAAYDFVWEKDENSVRDVCYSIVEKTYRIEKILQHLEFALSHDDRTAELAQEAIIEVQSIRKKLGVEYYSTN